MDNVHDTSTPTRPNPLNPIVAFVIGLSIIILASILNAAGLNLTKLDHVRTSAIPKSSRRRDWMRPLWLLGMLLYILSQVLGSTLALEYMRAEYVAPLGSISLVFNFLFARFLVGTPVTSTDIYGTIIVILGVIGIVAFGSINSGLASETDVARLTYLWRRPGWLGFFFCMAGALIVLLIVTGRLDSILVARGDLGLNSAVPSSTDLSTRSGDAPGRIGNNDSGTLVGSAKMKGGMYLVAGVYSGIRGLANGWQALMNWITYWIEVWSDPKDDKYIAWTLGIGWACCGGDLAGGCLVFAKATVKLLSGSLSKQNPGNQFGHAAPIFTILLLITTAILQILCLNRGLRVYDSTLVVPVFYGVYTATGFLDSLIFNDGVDAYQSWTLFLIFASILVLISGVVLLTHKKPEPTGRVPVALNQNKKGRDVRKGDEEDGTRREGMDNERTVLWAVGHGEEDELELELEDGDEDVDHHLHPIQIPHRPREGWENNGKEGKGKGKENGERKKKGKNWRVRPRDEEGNRLIDEDYDDHEVVEGRTNGRDPDARRLAGVSGGSNSVIGLKYGDAYENQDGFGEWEEAEIPIGRRQ